MNFKVLSGAVVAIATVVSAAAGVLAVSNQPQPAPAERPDALATEPGFLGIQFDDVTPRIRAQSTVTIEAGIYVTHVQDGSPAQREGIQVGDILLKINGRELSTGMALLDEMLTVDIGETVELVILRGNELVPVRVRAGDRKAFEAAEVTAETPLRAVPWPVPYEELNVARVSSLEFYGPDAKVWEVSIYGGDSMAAFIDLGHGMPVRLTGKSDVIHTTNKATNLQLETEEDTAAYLTFFTAFTWGEDGDAGPFRIVTSSDDILDLDPSYHDQLIFDVRRKDQAFEADVTLVYQNTLFEAKLTIEATGTVTMQQDTQIATRVGRSIEYKNGFWRLQDLEGRRAGSWISKPLMPSESWRNATGEEMNEFRQLILMAR